MESIDPLSLIPPEWVAIAAPWAARAFVALLVTTALVRLLLPVARRVEVWAIASAVTWDDGPARKTVEVLEWMAAATSAILAWVPRLTVGRLASREHEDKRLHAAKRPVEPSSGALALALIVVAGSTLATGCGPGALGMQARGVQVAAIATGGAGEVIDDARDRALDAVEEAHPTRGPERTAALEAEAERWRPAGQALDAIREVLISWAAAIEAARVLGDQGMAAIWPQILALGARAVALYGRIADLARELGADVPTLELGGLLGTGTTTTGGAR